MKLEEGRLSRDEWNDKIIPLIEQGVLKERLDLAESKFLMVYQAFEGIIEDSSGNLFRCTGWFPPQDPPYVGVRKPILLYDAGKEKL